MANETVRTPSKCFLTPMKELPSICPDGQHKFAPSKNTVTPTCGAFGGADVYAELTVFYTRAPKGYRPQLGDVCQDCFQIYGQANGSRDPHLVRCFEDLASWE